MQTREQKILAALGANLPDAPTCHGLRKRVRKLPSLYLRHGPAQVFLYLSGSDDDDKKLQQIVLSALSTLRPESPLARHKGKDLFVALAGQPLPDRLADQALCVEIASWLSRMIEARYQEVEAQKEEQRRKGASGEAR